MQPTKQRSSEFIFKYAHVTTNRRLGQMEFTRSFGKTQTARGGFERA
jgi:hypothetical protein